MGWIDMHCDTLSGIMMGERGGNRDAKHMSLIKNGLCVDVERLGRADSVGNQHYVFNIRGNNYRIVAVIKFTIKLVFIRFIGTHAEYDSIDAKNI